MNVIRAMKGLLLTCCFMTALFAEDAKAAEKGNPANNNGIIAPVSYTHLTLPTIILV